MRRYLRHIVFFLLLTCGCLSLKAQKFGGSPPSLKWRQLKTGAAQIIYPKGSDSVAFRVNAVIERLQKSRQFPLGDQDESVPVVLRTLTTNSNGYVGLGPYRSEFYLAAPMDVMELGSTDWATTLARHEYRHVIQYNNVNRGITRVMDRVLGDNARALFSDMAVPNWFFEGDAVFNETFHSRQGRGRLPRFMNVYAVLDKDGKRYTYQKLRNGSYKDYIPGRYPLGYLLVSYGYRQYGTTFWGKVLRDAAKYKGLFYPFQKAVRRVAGVSFKAFREAAFQDYLNHYQGLCWILPGDSSRPGFPFTRLSGISDHEVVDYRYPYPAAAGPEAGVIALKNARKSTGRFVWLQKGKEKDLGQAPISRNAYFGYQSGKIVYTRHQTDPRWGYKEYSDLEVLDIYSGKRERITHRGRYFTPDISGNGNWIAASELRPDGGSAIVVMDRAGHVMGRWNAPRGMIYNYPKFFATDSGSHNALLFLVRHGDGKMGISYVTWPAPLAGHVVAGRPVVNADTVKDLVAVSEQLLAFPVVQADKLCYVMAGPDNDTGSPYCYLMEIDLAAFLKGTGAGPVRISRSLRDLQQGYGTPAGSVVGSLQTAQGAGVFEWKYKKASQRSASGDFDYYLPLRPGADPVFSADFMEARSDLRDLGRQVRKYPLFSHPFHFHSLQPTIEDPVYSLDLLGQNVLNTVQTKLSYSYNRVSQMSSIGGDLTLGAWYLQPYVHMDYSWDHQAADRKGHRYYYKELTSQLGLQLPLNFTGGRWQRSLYLSTALSQSNLYWNQPAPASGTTLKQIRYLFSRLQFSVTAPQAVQQLYPRMGLYNYTEMNTPLDGKGARQWMNSLSLYLPGVLPTHSLRWNVAYQHRDTAGAYGYNSRFPFSRGYVRASYPTLWKFGLDYDLPLWYPDFGFAGLAYFSRVRANLYYDQSYGFDNFKRRSTLGSLGGAVFADMNIGNQYPVTIGLRYNHLLNPAFPDNNNWELILPIRLF